MTLRGRRIKKFVDLWCLVASRGLDIWVSLTSFQKGNIDRPQQPPTERVSEISKKLDFWWSIPQKELILIIWVLGMIQPSGSVIFLVKWGCWGHWSHWGCWDYRSHWGYKGSKAWKITTDYWRIIQVPEYSFILMFWKPVSFLESWNIKLNFGTS